MRTGVKIKFIITSAASQNSVQSTSLKVHALCKEHSIGKAKNCLQNEIHNHIDAVCCTIGQITMQRAGKSYEFSPSNFKWGATLKMQTFQGQQPICFSYVYVCHCSLYMYVGTMLDTDGGSVFWTYISHLSNVIGYSQLMGKAAYQTLTYIPVGVTWDGVARSRCMWLKLSSVSSYAVYGCLRWSGYVVPFLLSTFLTHLS